MYAGICLTTYVYICLQFAIRNRKDTYFIILKSDFLMVVNTLGGSLLVRICVCSVSLELC